MTSMKNLMTISMMILMMKTKMTMKQKTLSRQMMMKQVTGNMCPLTWKVKIHQMTVKRHQRMMKNQMNKRKSFDI